MDTKICTKCKLEIPIEDFGNSKKSSDGKSSWCKNCLNAKSRKSKMNNPIRARANQIRNHMNDRTKKVGMYVDPYFTSENILEMIKEIDYCPCGRKLDKSYTGDEKKNPAAPSLDRFDSTIGYTKENVHVVCARCNHLKNDSTVEELYKIAVYITKFSPN